MRVRRIFSCVFLAAATLFVGAPCAGAEEAVAEAREPDHTKLIEYYRRKANIAPGQTVTVRDWADAPVDGFKQGVIDSGAGKENFLSSADGRYVVFGELVDVTLDPWEANRKKIDLAEAISRGPADAPVVIVEYSDFQCPFCAKGFDILEKDVLPAYEGKVRFVYKHHPLPFHPWALPAAVAFECAKRQSAEAAWAVYRGSFAQQKTLSVENVKEKAREFAADASAETPLDTTAFDQCFDQQETLPRVEADRAEAAALRITGTPSFVINGRVIRGAVQAAQFRAVIDDELGRAE